MKSINNNCDILIITIDAELELPSLLKIFRNDYNGSIYEEGIYYWKKSIQTKYKGTLEIAIVALIEQGNPHAGSKSMKLLKYFNPFLAFLIGTAAGVKKLKLGDVVICDKIHYYESKRLETSGGKPKPKEKNVDSDLLSNLSHFLGNIFSSKLPWDDYYYECISSIEKNDLPKLIDETKPNLKIGHIACGEKLFVDGSLQKLNDEVDNKIIAGETEAYGFASACEEEKVPWIVLRGISDYGEPKSKDGTEKDKFHLPSVAAAGSFCRYFIENGLKMDISNSRKTTINNLKLSKSLVPLRIQTALISVGDKSNFDIIIPFLVKKNVEIITTYGSFNFIKSYTSNFKTTNEYVKCESIAGTRGTLHPYILAAIKVCANDTNDIQKLKSHNINKIDIVFVNAKAYKLPDFTKPDKILEQISKMQVGAPALLRWIIRHNRNCISVTSPDDYVELIEHLENNNMIVSSQMRLYFLRKSFQYLSEKDKEIQLFLNKIWSRNF